jgi:hypothetical protein
MNRHNPEVGIPCALLLAFSSGRPSEPAAVRSDAGPDRAAAGTGGIADVGPSSYRDSSTAG